MYRSVITALALSAIPLGAQSPPRTITFDDAVGIALKQNVAIRQAQNATALDETAVRQQQLQFLPDLRFNVSGAENLGRSFSQTEGRVIDQSTQAVSTGVSSSVTLFNGGQNVANLRAARLVGQAGTQDLARTRQTVVFTVASNYLNLVAQQEQLRVQQQNLAALQAQEEQIKRFVDVGSRPISDLYQQQASVAAARASVVETQRALELAKVDLIQTLQLDPAGTYEFVAPVVSDAAAAGRQYHLDSLVARAYARRADIDADEARVGAAEQEVKAAQASKWPTISLSLGYNTAYSSASDLSVADQLNQRRGGSIGIGVSIPLFDRGSADLATQRAHIQADNARLALQQQQQQVALEVRRAYLDHRAAQERLAAARAQQVAADQALAATRERYRVGAATLVELTQSQAAQVQAASALVNARYNLVFQQSLMSYYTGELDPAKVSLGD
ncbi:MAG: TolC family protein [Gemmatimonadota bacterium]|nr:TolC family protein [Gemmatimonadota bacterium]